MIIRKYVFFLVAIICVPPSVNADSVSQLFPLVVNDINAQVAFNVDSTWHLIEGRVSGIGGNIQQNVSSDLHSISGSITFPVKSFDTGNSMRDTRLREVMDAEKYPIVEFLVSGTEGDCELEKLLEGEKNSCVQVLKGTLKIKGVVRDMDIPSTITVSKAAELNIQGETSFSWRDFHIEDPSILVAKLHEVVNVRFNINISAK